MIILRIFDTSFVYELRDFGQDCKDAARMDRMFLLEERIDERLILLDPWGLDFAAPWTLSSGFSVARTHDFLATRFLKYVSPLFGNFIAFL